MGLKDGGQDQQTKDCKKANPAQAAAAVGSARLQITQRSALRSVVLCLLPLVPPGRLVKQVACLLPPNSQMNHTIVTERRQTRFGGQRLCRRSTGTFLAFIALFSLLR
jgi:hypothetical protein